MKKTTFSWLDAADSGLYAADKAHAAKALAAAQTLGFGSFTVDLSQAERAPALFDALAEVLDFPDWFGRNWDALADCLGDLSWLPAEQFKTGVIIVFEGLGALHKKEPKSLRLLCQVLHESAVFWREDQMPFWVILVNEQGEVPRGVPTLPEILTHVQT